jgi:hypothetical protein
MRLEYRLKFRDYLLFNATHQFLAPKTQVLYLLVAVAMYAMFVRKAGAGPALVLAVTIYIVQWIAQVAFTALSLHSTRNKSLLTDHVLEVQDEGLYHETRFVRSVHYWPGVATAVRRAGFAAVYLSSHGAHIIPRRAFASDQQVDRFVELVEERIRAARQTG